jgi:hypothetical protein
MAFLIIILVWLARRTPLSDIVVPAHFHDLANLMLAFVMLWAYLSFAQFLIIWSGNIAEEQPFFLRRKEGPWLAIGLFLVVFHFALPFLVLLSRNLKKNPGKLVIVAVWLILLRWVDLGWYIVPAIHHSDGSVGHLHWMDAAAPIALFSLWLALFLQSVKGRIVVSPRDQEYEATLEGVPLATTTHH